MARHCNLKPKDILKQAQEGKYALGSFNFSTAEVLRAIIESAQAAKSPVIVSTSEGEADFFGLRQAAALVESWRLQPGLPIILNLDHGKSLDKIKQAVEAGYSAIHFDGSKYDYEENIAKTKEAVDFVKSVNQDIIVEGELGYLRGSSSLHEEILEIKEEDLTKPDQAADFVQRTGIDSLAMVIGNAHGVYTQSPEKLRLNRLGEIKAAVGGQVFLVLHGGSGVPPEDVRGAVELGIVKVNVNTDMRLAWRQGLEKSLQESQDATPYKLLQRSYEAVREVVKNKISTFKT